MDDVAIEHIQHLREVPRAARDLQPGVVIIGRIDSEIARRAGHDLGEPEGPHGGAGPDQKAALLPDQRLQKAAPLDQRQASTAHAGQAVGVSRGANDQFFDPFPGIAEHPGCSRIVVLGRVEAGGLRFRRHQPPPAPPRARATVPATSPEPRDMASMSPSSEASCWRSISASFLLPAEPVLLQRQIAVGLLEDRLSFGKQAQIEGRHALRCGSPHIGNHPAQG